MRELIGTKRTSDPSVTTSVYRSDLVYCCECKKTVPVGIEVITTRKGQSSRTVLKRQSYCRVHGIEYESMIFRQPLNPDTKPKSDNDAFLRNYSKRN
jgi:hypothetical protein